MNGDELAAGELRPEPLLTTGEVAEVLRVHPKHVYRLLRRGIPARRVGGKWLFARDEVLQWARREGARDPAGLAAARAEPSPLLAADADPLVELLLEQARSRGRPLLGLVPADRAVGLELVAADEVIASSWNGGQPPRLGDAQLVQLHLARREVGLLLRPGLKTRGLRALARLRFARRPPTAGLGDWLEGPLRRAGGIDARRLEGPLCNSHHEVACAVASGGADVGPAPRAWAERLGLPFLRLGYERCSLLLGVGQLGHPAAVRLCEVAQSAAFRAAVRELPGHEVSEAGNLRLVPGVGGDGPR